MPIKPENRRRYPSNWVELATSIKETADWVCEKCGQQCRRPGEKFDTHRRTLTVAHLDHTPENCAPDNLRPWCAPCHIRYDAPHHAQTAAATRHAKKQDATP
jgi:hypothetical protein